MTYRSFAPKAIQFVLRPGNADADPIFYMVCASFIFALVRPKTLLDLADSNDPCLTVIVEQLGGPSVLSQMHRETRR